MADHDDPRALLEEAAHEAATLRQSFSPIREYRAHLLDRLASALRAALDERDLFAGQLDEADREIRDLTTQRDTAQADVEAMRAVVEAARFVADYAECPGRLLQDALRALDARATPNAKETKP